MGKYIIRKAKPDDAYGIAYVNVYTSYSAYKGLMLEKHLINRINTIKEFSEKMRKVIENGTEHLVAEDSKNNKIIGILGYGPSRNEDYPNSGEIIALYVLPEYQKLGIGKKLFLAGVDELIKLGFNDMIVNVLKGNNALNFYKKYNGKIIGEKSDQFGEKTLQEDIIYFDNLTSIK